MNRDKKNQQVKEFDTTIDIKKKYEKLLVYYYHFEIGARANGVALFDVNWIDG